MRALRRKQPINPSIIKNYIFETELDTQMHYILVIPNLLFDSTLKINSFSEIKSQVITLVNIFCILYPLNYTEQEWYRMYNILKAYREATQDLEEILQAYNNLPPLNSTKDSMKWIQYQVKTMMLSYYIVLQLDYEQIVQEINATPEAIKNLHY